MYDVTSLLVTIFQWVAITASDNPPLLKKEDAQVPYLVPNKHLHFRGQQVPLAHGRSSKPLR
jgi:hypothetical protein